MKKPEPPPNPKTAWPFPKWKDGKMVKPRKKKPDHSDVEAGLF